MKKRKQQRAYFDYAAATPLAPEIVAAMKPFLKAGVVGLFGNASSVHKEGDEVKKILNKCRKDIALKLFINPDEIIFTSGGTESNNLAIIGVFNKSQDFTKTPHIISSSIEHASILEPIRKLEEKGVKVTYLLPDKNGVITAESVKKVLTPNTILVTLSLVNGEIGTEAKTREIGNVIRKFKDKMVRSQNDYPYFHTDASQAGTLLPLAPHNLRVDLLTADASKMYGPKGIGLLAKLREVNMEPSIYGGGQENGFRSGTENIAGIVGLTTAILEAEKERDKEWSRLSELKKYFVSQIKEKIPEASFNTLNNFQIPSFVSVCVPGLNSEFAVIQLDQMGVAASSASACGTIGGTGFSYVLAALPEGKACAGSSIRLTLARSSTKKEIDLAVKALQKVCQEQKNSQN